MEVKKVNWFLPVFIIAYMALSFAVMYGIAFALMVFGVKVPDWCLYVLSEAIVLIIVLIYMAIMRVNIKNDMMYHKISLKDAFVSLLTGYLMLPMVLFINNISMLFSNNYLDQSSQGLLAYPYIVQVILMAVIPPLVEEFAFRGLFYGTYRKNGILKAALMSGLIFGMFHLNINQFCYAFVIGIVFAFMVEATGSIWSSVIAHFAINTYSITVVQIFKLAGMYDTIISASESEQVVQVSVLGQIIQYAIMFGIAVGFMSLVYLCIKKMAQRNNRWEYIRQDVKNFRLKSDDGRSVCTLPAIVTIAACFVYMICMEIF